MTTSTYEAVEAAVADRLRSVGANPEAYDLEWLTRQFPTPTAVSEMDPSDWYCLIGPYEKEAQTKVPCPSWCRYPAFHPYETEDDDRKQVRYHALQLEAPVGVDLSITAEEKRERENDSTARSAPPSIWLTVDRDGLDAATSREIATALLHAGHKLDSIQKVSR